MRSTVLMLVSVLPLLLRGQLAIWGEEFENSCAQGCYTLAFTGPNGAWTVTNTGTNGACANRWFMSCEENAQLVGACGARCGSDETLHVGNDSVSQVVAVHRATSVAAFLDGEVLRIIGAESTDAWSLADPIGRIIARGRLCGAPLCEQLVPVAGAYVLLVEAADGRRVIPVGRVLR